MTDWLTRWPPPLAASAFLAVLLATCGRPAGVARLRREPDLRIALVRGAPQARVGGQAAVAAASAGRPVFRLSRDESVTIVPEGRALRVRGGDGGRYESLSFVSLDPARFVTVNGKPYRGVVEVLAGGGVTVINVLPLEAYVAGVVSAEMGQRGPAERAALEAQAIVSRTYAVFNRGRYASEGFDLAASVADQVYGGVESETDLGWAAVRATTAQVVTYRGEPIEAFFHSACGYATASPEEIFRFGRPLPYLRSVSDRKPGGYYCDISPNFRWTVEWGGAELADILRRTVPSVLGIERGKMDVVKNVEVHRTGPSGRVAELRIEVGQGVIPVFGPDVRAVLQRPDGRSLGSTAIQLQVEKRGGAVTRVVAQGAGWGHGVGFCQWGAVGRARAGQDAHAIVTTYFPGTRIERWY